MYLKQLKGIQYDIETMVNKQRKKAITFHRSYVTLNRIIVGRYCGNLRDVPTGVANGAAAGGGNIDSNNVKGSKRE